MQDANNEEASEGGTPKRPIPRYSERVIAFIDVLGFGSLVMESGKRKIGKRGIMYRISEAIDWSLDELEGNTRTYGRLSDVAFTQFSDSVVVSARAAADKYSVLKMLVHTKKLLFGPAMNRAYLLESQVANYPRIIVDPELPKPIALSGFQDIVATDDVGIQYVDYFDPHKRFFIIPMYRLNLQSEAVPKTEQLSGKHQWLIRKDNHSLRGYSYKDFSRKLQDYCDDTDANNAVVEDSDKILAAARKVHRL
jgi:hypothetical protein